MLTPFKTHLSNFMSSRAEEISCKLVSTNNEYIQLLNKSTVLYHSIYDLLPIDARGLLDEYDSNVNLMRALTYDAMYEQGLKDGVKLLRSLQRG